MVEAHGVVLGRSMVIVDGPDLSRVLAFVRSAIERPEAPTWTALAHKLTRLGVYEFEGS
jgi:Immunity protein 8